MNRAQRALLVCTLGSLAVICPIYSLEYRSQTYWQVNSKLLDGQMRQPEPVLRVYETVLEQGSSNDIGVVRLSAFYPRPGLTFGEGVLGGVFGPVIFLFTAAYFALSGRRHARNFQDVRKYPMESATLEIPKSQNLTDIIAPPPAPSLKLYRSAAIAGVVAPMLWVIDTPAMLLMMGTRFPRWVFAFLVLYAIRGCAER